jgi:DHA2 family multidrug resistance protein
MDVFMGLTVLFIALVFLVLLLKKPQGAAPADAGH